MKLVELQQKLLAAARRNPPSDRVPFAFETRVMARLISQPLLDVWALWARALWRAAAPCVAIMLVLGAWSLFTPASPPANNNLSQDLENTLNTLLATVDQDQPLDPSL
jgi:hypothetical protein